MAKATVSTPSAFSPFCMLTQISGHPRPIGPTAIVGWKWSRETISDLSRLETLRRADPLKESGFLLKEVNSLLHPYGAISKVENLEKEVQDRYYLPISVIVEFEMCDARRDALGDCRVRNVRRSRSSSNTKCSTLAEMFSR
ncbi:hypothetical protein AUP68_00950 [Ilyonectria robusta]